MSKVSIIEELCTGCGLCAATCPSGFEITPENKAIVVNDGGECDLSQVASECPVEAIKVE